MSEHRLGIDLGGTKIQAVRLDGAGKTVDELRRATPRGDYAATLDALEAVARQLDPEGALTVGIGTPGSPDRSGHMRNCNSVWLNGRCLLADLRGRLGDRVRIANDADCFALSEAHGGAADGAASVFGVILGTGVGGGLVLGGRLHEGRNGLAGEWGHMALPRFPSPTDVADPGLEAGLRSRHCYCGQLNCVETFLSGPGLAASHRELWGERLSAEAIYERAVFTTAPALEGMALVPDAPLARDETDSGKRARQTLSLWCRQLARALAQVVNVVDPQVIVLGGGLSKMRELYEPLRSLLAQEVFGGSCDTPVLAPRFGDASGVRGAAWLFGGPGRGSERSAPDARVTN